MQKHDVVFSDEAVEDLNEIVTYLSNFSDEIALGYHELIVQKAKSLSLMPERCPLVTYARLRAKGYRWLFVRNYTIFFTIQSADSTVVIRRILYARREYTAFL